MDITISLTEKQFDKISKFLQMFSVNIKPPVTPPVVPKKELTIPEKVMKQLEKLWKKDLYVSYSDVMRQGHFTADELKKALLELKKQNKITFFECAEAGTNGQWPALYIGRSNNLQEEEQFEDFEKQIQKKSPNKTVIRHKIPCWLIHHETGECKYFPCMNDAWRFLGVGRGNFRPSAKNVNGYVYNGWRFCFPEESYNPESYDDEK